MSNQKRGKKEVNMNQKQSFSDNIRMKDRVRGSRYCEILVVTGNIFKLTATVYNTLGCNDCQPDQWEKLTSDKIKKELHAKAVLMNGPRYFMMDRIGQIGAAVPPTVSFNGLEMKERATVQVPLWLAMKGKANPYKERIVRRSTMFVFEKGSEVYQLISPRHAYIMQSYAQIVDPKLSESDLPKLQSRLKLPEGWQYKVVNLEADLVLQTSEANPAIVIQDDLLNSYQRIEYNYILA